MKKNEIIERVAEQSVVSKIVARNVVSALFDVIIESLKQDNNASFLGFGSFNLKLRAARQGRNPKTGEAIEIKEQNVVTFKAGSVLKEEIAITAVVK